MIFKSGDIIKNKKTGKIGIVVDCNCNDSILKYYLIRTPNNIHICINPKERFDLFKISSTQKI